MKKLLFVAMCVFLSFSVASAGEKSLTITWEKTILEADLAGFELSYSSVGGEGTAEVSWAPFPNATASKIPFVAGKTAYTTTQTFTSPNGQSVKYWFRVCAYDKSGNRSVWCYKDTTGAPATTTIDFESPGAAVNFKVTVTVQSN